MAPLQHTFSPYPNRTSFYVFYFLFLFNEYIIRSHSLRKKIWDLLKCELFYVAGGCQNTGNCCRNLVLVKKGEVLKHIKDFEKLKTRQPIYKRFMPIMSSANRIRFFSCSSLSTTNRCHHYETRPKFCRNYPLSAFIQSDCIPLKCGYNVQRKQFLPVIKNKQLLTYISNLVFLNRLQSENIL